MKRADLATKTVDEQWAAIRDHVYARTEGSGLYELCRARFYEYADTYQGSLFTKTHAELGQDALEEQADYHIYKATQALPE